MKREGEKLNQPLDKKLKMEKSSSSSFLQHHNTGVGGRTGEGSPYFSKSPLGRAAKLAQEVLKGNKTEASVKDFPPKIGPSTYSKDVDPQNKAKKGKWPEANPFHSSDTGDATSQMATFADIVPEKVLTDLRDSGNINLERKKQINKILHDCYTLTRSRKTLIGDSISTLSAVSVFQCACEIRDFLKISKREDDGLFYRDSSFENAWEAVDQWYRQYVKNRSYFAGPLRDFKKIMEGLRPETQKKAAEDFRRQLKGYLRDLGKEVIKFHIDKNFPKKKFLAVFTGGTIGSVLVDNDIVQPSEAKRRGFDTKDIKSLLLDEYNKRYKHSKIEIGHESIMETLSENMTLEKRITLARKLKDILKNIDPKECHGIILTHGSDTLGYTANYLSLLLADMKLKVPIVLVSLIIRERGNDFPLFFGKRERTRGHKEREYCTYDSREERMGQKEGTSLGLWYWREGDQGKGEVK